MFKLLTLAALGLTFVHAQDNRRNVGTLTTNSTQVVPLVIIGEGWSQKIVLSNVDKTDSAVGTIQFYTKDGQPWTVETTSGTANTFLLNVSPGAVQTIETTVKQTPQVLGWALITQTSNGLGDILGQTVFRKQTDGRADLMTSMVLADRAFQELLIYFDNTGGNYTGLGILISEFCTFSSCQGDEPYDVTIRDTTGTVISSKRIQQKRGRLYWMNLGVDFPETNGKRGTFKVVSPNVNYLSGFSLQFAGNGAFTAITPYEN
ncbi:MAG: hypothetical protein ABIR70_17450 [Bryobacteraceae bacterium]